MAGMKLPEAGVSKLLREIDVVVSSREQQLMKVLEQRDAELASARQQVSSLDSLLREKETASVEMQTELDQLRSRLQVSFGIEEQVQQLQAQSEELRRKHDHTLVKQRQKLQRAVRKNKELDAGLSARSAELERKSEEVKLLQSRVSSSSASERSSAEQLRAVRAHNTALSDKCHLLQQQLDKSESQCSFLYRQLDEVQAFHRSQICGLEEKLEEAQHVSINSLDQLKQSLEKQQNVSRQITEENLRYRQQLSDAASQLQLLEEQKVATQQDHDLLKRQLKSAEKESERQQQRISELESALQSKNDVIRAFEDCEQRSVSVEITRLQHELEQANKELVQNGHTEQHLCEKMHHCQQRVDSLQAECSSVRAELKEALGEVANWQHQYTALQHETNSAVKVGESSTREVANLREELRRAQAQLTDSELKVTQQEQQLCEIHLQLRKATELQLSTQAQLKLANSQLDNLRVENAQLMQSQRLALSEPIFLRDQTGQHDSSHFWGMPTHLSNVARSDQATITSVSSLSSADSQTVQASSPEKSSVPVPAPHQLLTRGSHIDPATQSVNTPHPLLSSHQVQSAASSSPPCTSTSTHSDLVDQIVSRLSGAFQQGASDIAMTFTDSKQRKKPYSTAATGPLRHDSASMATSVLLQVQPQAPAATSYSLSMISGSHSPTKETVYGSAGKGESGSCRGVSVPVSNHGSDFQPCSWLTSSGSSISSLTSSSASQTHARTVTQHAQTAPFETSPLTCSALSSQPHSTLSSDALPSDFGSTGRSVAQRFTVSSSPPDQVADPTTFSLTETLENFLIAEEPSMKTRVAQSIDKVRWMS